MRVLLSLVALCASWLVGVELASAQSCINNQQCGPGTVCGPAGVCVQSATVTVQGGAGQGTVQGQVTVQPVPPPPQQQGGVVVQPQPQPQPVYQQPVYAQPQPIREPRIEERPIWGLIIPGIAMLAAGYVVNIFVSLIGAVIIGFDRAVTGSSTTTADAFFYSGLVPIAGPFVQIGLTEGDDGWLPYLLIDGILQTAGLTMIILGAVLKEQSEVYTGIDLEEGVRMSFSPMPLEGGMGLSGNLSF